jgi:signal peptidase I
MTDPTPRSRLGDDPGPGAEGRVADSTAADSLVADSLVADEPGEVGDVDGLDVLGDDGTGEGGDDAADDDDDDDDDARSGRVRNIVEWVVVVVGALVVALVIKTFLFQAFYIPSESMVPTLEVGDRVIVNKLSDGTGRGDLVVFAKPEGEGGTVQDLIKRVIGLPGETVSATDNQIYIDKNDGEGPVALDEPYLPEGTITNDFQGEPIPEGHLFMMGDNRDDSRDSRFFGPIPESDVVGRAFLRVWPPADIGLL